MMLGRKRALGYIGSSGLEIFESLNLAHHPSKVLLTTRTPHELTPQGVSSLDPSWPSQLLEIIYAYRFSPRQQASVYGF